MEFQFRTEIRDFIAADETILSPIHLVPPMTIEEKQLVQVYVRELAIRCKEEVTACELSKAEQEN